MKTKVFTLAVLLRLLLAKWLQIHDCCITESNSSQNQASTVGALPPLRSWNPNCSVWKGHDFSEKCLHCTPSILEPIGRQLLPEATGI